MNQQEKNASSGEGVSYSWSYTGPNYVHNEHRPALKLCILICAGLSIPIYLFFQSLIAPVLICTFFTVVYRDGFGKVVCHYSISKEKAEYETSKKFSSLTLFINRNLLVVLVVVGLGAAIIVNDLLILAGGGGLALIQVLKIKQTDWTERHHRVFDTVDIPWQWAYLDRPNKVITLRKPYSGPLMGAIIDDDDENPAKEGEDPCTDYLPLIAQDEAQLDGIIALAKAGNPDFFTIEKNLWHPKGYGHTFKDWVLSRI